MPDDTVSLTQDQQEIHRLANQARTGIDEKERQLHTTIDRIHLFLIKLFSKGTNKRRERRFS